MESFNEFVGEYRKQMAKGHIQKAYRGLMEYIMALKTHFKNKYPEYSVPGSIYHGYMDMTYFPLFPESLKSKKLKIAVVFVHEAVRFELWLAANNKRIQTEYWKLFMESGWDKYHIPSTIKGIDSVVEYVVVDNPDFSNLDTLTDKIETGTLTFISDIEHFLSGH